MNWSVSVVYQTPWYKYILLYGYLQKAIFGEEEGKKLFEVSHISNQLYARNTPRDAHMKFTANKRVEIAPKLNVCNMMIWQWLSKFYLRFDSNDRAVNVNIIK